MGVRISRKQAAQYGLKAPNGPSKAQSHVQAAPGLFLAACAAHGLPEPVPEYAFCPGRRFKFDWLFSGQVALEIEGGMFGIGPACPTCKRKAVGAHSSIERLKRDMEKYNLAGIMGYVVIRALPEQVESGEAFALVKRALGGE
jgi:hypothetical protein